MASDHLHTTRVSATAIECRGIAFHLIWAAAHGGGGLVKRKDAPRAAQRSASVWLLLRLPLGQGLASLAWTNSRQGKLHRQRV